VTVWGGRTRSSRVEERRAVREAVMQKEVGDKDKAGRKGE